MKAALNALIPRDRLDEMTAPEACQSREPLSIDRRAFREDVHEMGQRLRKKDIDRGRPAGFVERLAIVPALINRGHPRPGGWR
jgi:hypothetical protein